MGAMSRTISDWLHRDYPMTELLFTIATSDDSLRDEVLGSAWRAAVRARPDDDDARAVVLGEVLRSLNELGRLHPGPPTVTMPGPFLPAGDPWEDWWVDDDAVSPLPAGLRRGPVVATLRGLPLGHRVLLFLRDCAGLDPRRAAALVAGSGDQQGELLRDARIGFICLIDDHIDRRAAA